MAPGRTGGAAVPPAWGLLGRRSLLSDDELLPTMITSPLLRRRRSCGNASKWMQASADLTVCVEVIKKLAYPAPLRP